MSAIGATSSHGRLLQAAKELFAQHGYEQTSTAAIATRAGTSESQLVKLFGGKRGLLTAIFDEGWAALNATISRRVTTARDPLAAIDTVLVTIIDAFQRDRDLAYLLLFEGRRMRDRGLKLELSRGYEAFVRFLIGLIRNAQRERRIAPHLSSAALASALMGAAEGMIRDRMVAQLSGRPQPFSRAQVTKIFSSLLRAVPTR
jgi:AcrR family transcriptional regulator